MAVLNALTMRPTLNKLTRRHTWKTAGVCFVAVCLFVSVFGIARADSTNFTGDFAATFWNAQPQAGAIGFSNSATELVIAGPNKPASETTSVDPITYNGPTSSGLVTDGTVEFDYTYNSPFGLADSAYFAWTPFGGTPTQVLLAQGGGVNITNSFSIDLSQGTTFEFVLFTDTPANKVGGSLTITDFTFHENVPEPSSCALFAGALILLAGSRRRGLRR